MRLDSTQGFWLYFQLPFAIALCWMTAAPPLSCSAQGHAVGAPHSRPRLRRVQLLRALCHAAASRSHLACQWLNLGRAAASQAPAIVPSPMAFRLYSR